MAKRSGQSQTAVSRIWRAFGLWPRRSETFKLAKDPLLHRQSARDRRALSRPPGQGVGAVRRGKIPDRSPRSDAVRAAHAPRADRASHTRLHAARHHDALRRAGCQERRNHRRISSAPPGARVPPVIVDHHGAVPAELDVHLIVDNASTHKTPMIHRWLLRHPRGHVHFTPTCGSWMNLVERWFARSPRSNCAEACTAARGNSSTAIRRYIDITNEQPKPFGWPKTADEILASVARFWSSNL